MVKYAYLEMKELLKYNIQNSILSEDAFNIQTNLLPEISIGRNIPLHTDNLCV